MAHMLFLSKPPLRAIIGVYSFVPTEDVIADENKIYIESQS